MALEPYGSSKVTQQRFFVYFLMQPSSSYDEFRNVRVRLTYLCFSPPQAFANAFADTNFDSSGRNTSAPAHIAPPKAATSIKRDPFHTCPSNYTRDFSVGLDADVVPHAGTRLRADSDTHVPVSVSPDRRRAPYGSPYCIGIPCGYSK